MSSPPALSAAEIVKQARLKLGLSQCDFAIALDKSQGVISRYEKGLVIPPGDVIMHCMNIVLSDVHARPVGDPGWNKVLAALDTLSSAIRAMQQRDAGPMRPPNRNR